MSASFFSGFRRALSELSVRSHSPACGPVRIPSANTACQFIAANWSRCFWMIEENQWVISNSFLWRRWNRIIAQKVVKSLSLGINTVRFQIRCHGSGSGDGCFQNYLQEERAQSPTQSPLRHMISYPLLVTHFFDCQPRNSSSHPSRSIYLHISGILPLPDIGTLGEEMEHCLGGYIKQKSSGVFIISFSWSLQMT